MKSHEIICFNNKESMRKYFVSNKNFIDHSMSGNPSKFEISFNLQTNTQVKSNILLKFLNRVHIND